MKDRDTLFELYGIVFDSAKENGLRITLSALEEIQNNFGKGCDTYYRRRLSVCRMLIKFHLPIEDVLLDAIVATSLCHFLPGDVVPDTQTLFIDNLCSKNMRIAEIYAVLKQNTYADLSYYERLTTNKYALLIRLTERGVLVESLYDWKSTEAKVFISQTKESFFPLCIYAKENYPEFRAAATILMEKTRNLISANEALLNRFDAIEDSLMSEITFLKEENAALRAMIAKLKR